MERELLQICLIELRCRQFVNHGSSYPVVQLTVHCPLDSFLGTECVGKQSQNLVLSDNADKNYAMQSNRVE